MNKKELINTVSDKENLTKKEAESLVDCVFDTIAETLVDGDNVLISGFRTFRFKDCPPRKGVSPKTGDYMIIPASKKVSFKPSNKLKDAMNN